MVAGKREALSSKREPPPPALPLQGRSHAIREEWPALVLEGPSAGGSGGVGGGGGDGSILPQLNHVKVYSEALEGLAKRAVSLRILGAAQEEDEKALQGTCESIVSETAKLHEKLHAVSSRMREFDGRREALTGKARDMVCSARALLDKVRGVVGGAEWRASEDYARELSRLLRNVKNLVATLLA